MYRLKTVWSDINHNHCQNHLREIIFNFLLIISIFPQTWQKELNKYHTLIPVFRLARLVVCQVLSYHSCKWIILNKPILVSFIQTEQSTYCFVQTNFLSQISCKLLKDGDMNRYDCSFQESSIIRTERKKNGKRGKDYHQINQSTSTWPNLLSTSKPRIDWLNMSAL